MDPHLATLGHDLRSPLSGIIGLAELMSTEADGRPALQEHIAMVQDHAQYMLDLVNGLVVSAKAGTSDDAKPCLQPMSPWDLAVNVARTAALSRVHVPVRVEVAGQIPERILCDPLLLRQILTNLMGNAVRFTNEGGVRLHLDHTPGSERLRFAVIDTGPGIHPALLATLFKADTRIERPVGQESGHGLGLWIAKRLTEVLGGTVTVRTAAGRGTSIVVEVPTGPLLNIPLRTASDLRGDDLSPRSGLPIVPPGTLAGRHILVADDMAANRLFAATVLKRAGASVTLASDGAEALRRAELAGASGWHFDALVLDHHMPHCTATQLRQQGYSIPLLCWSSDTGLTTDPKVFDVMIPKPIDPDQLVAHITQALHVHR